MVAASRRPARNALRISIPADKHAPAVGRGAAKGFCSESWLTPSQRHTAVLLVSELVTNAVQHALAPTEAPIVLSLRLRRGVLRVEVTDQGDGFSPRPREADRKLGGYGLQLVQSAAARWGVDRRGGTRVWFELASSESG